MTCVIYCWNFGRHKLNMVSFFFATVGFACHMHKNSLCWGVCRNLLLITTVLSLCTMVIIKWLYWLILSRNFVIHFYRLCQLYKKKWPTWYGLRVRHPTVMHMRRMKIMTSTVKLFFLCNNKDILVAYHCNNHWC